MFGYLYSLSIYGKDKVYCHCSMIQMESKQDEQKSEMHSKIRIQLIVNGKLVHPISERDQILQILKSNKFPWKKKYGIKKFLHEDWKKSKNHPSMYLNVQNENARYSQQYYCLTVTVIIKDHHEYLTKIRNEIHYTPDLEKNIIHYVGKALQNTKRIKPHFLYSASEQRVMYISFLLFVFRFFICCLLFCL